MFRCFYKPVTTKILGAERDFTQQVDHVVIVSDAFTRSIGLKLFILSVK